MRRQLVESLLASNYSERVADDECKSKSWKTGNPYLAANIPEGPLMSVTSVTSGPSGSSGPSGPCGPFARDHSKMQTRDDVLEEARAREEEQEQLRRLHGVNSTCPREMIRGSAWEDDFPPPIGADLRVPCRFDWNAHSRNVADHLQILYEVDSAYMRHISPPGQAHTDEDELLSTPRCAGSQKLNQNDLLAFGQKLNQNGLRPQE